MPRYWSDQDGWIEAESVWGGGGPLTSGDGWQQKPGVTSVGAEYGVQKKSKERYGKPPSKTQEERIAQRREAARLARAREREELQAIRAARKAYWSQPIPCCACGRPMTQQERALGQCGRCARRRRVA